MNTTFNGRLRPKQKEPKDWADLTKLPNEKMAFIYERLSTHEQIKKSIYSIKAQDALVDLAKEDGYSDSQIYVEKRDLGISGTKGREEREGLAYLIQLVEANQVESIYVIHISRLYRDQTLINAFALGELFKEHNVIIVTPQMRLNLKDKMHMRLYRMEIERAADELDLLNQRLRGPLNLKAKAGLYAGEGVPTGYVVDERRELNGMPNPNFHTYQIFEPHAEVVKVIFNQLAMPGMTPVRVVRYCGSNGINFAPFPPELDTKANRKSFSNAKRNPNGSWKVTTSRVNRIATNPAYIGWKFWNGEIIGKDIFPPIIDETTFWTVQERFGHSPSRPKKDSDPLPLAGLLYCANHDIERLVTYVNRKPARYSIYQCYDHMLGLCCSSITATILDGPISEAVISQLTLSGLSEEVLNKLNAEYEQAKEQTASYRREVKRLDVEIENLRGNLSRGILSAEQLNWTDTQIQSRLARIRELADLENRPIGAAVGKSVPGQADIELVKSFLHNLGSKWASMPNGLKNQFLHLILDRVVICHDPSTIRVRLVWKVGLEQSLIIYRAQKGEKIGWTEAELDILRQHFPTADIDTLVALLPGRSLRALRDKAWKLGLRREEKPFSSKGEKYTPEEDEAVRRYYAGEIEEDEVKALTGRSRYSIWGRAATLGLSRQRRQVTWEWLDEDACRNLESESPLVVTTRPTSTLPGIFTQPGIPLSNPSSLANRGAGVTWMK